MKGLILFFLVFLAVPRVYGLIDQGYSVVVEISKTKEGRDAFDVVNLANEENPVKAAQFVFRLYQDSQSKERRYSNTVHLRFSSGYETKEIKRIWSIFEMSKVYVITTTVEKDGKRVTLEKDIGILDDLDAMLEIGGLSPEEEKNLREMRRKAENPERVGTDQPVIKPADK